MIEHRKDKGKDTISIYELAKKVKTGATFESSAPLRIEISNEAAKIGRWGKIHFRNLGDESYTIFETDPIEALKVLAYEAHEWQATEVLKEFKRKLQLTNVEFGS